LKKQTAIALIFLFSSVFPFSGYGQSGLIAYGSRNQPALNPSFLSLEKPWAVSVFPFSLIDVDLYLPFSIRKALYPGTDGGWVIDPGRLAERISHENLLMFHASADYLNVGTVIKSNPWMFRISENAMAAFFFDKNLIHFLDQGNKALTGSWFETQFKLGLFHYTTFQATTSRRLNDQFRLGLSAKLYLGKSGMDATAQLRLFTEERAEYLDVEMKGNVLASLPLERNINPAGQVNGWHVNPDGTLLGYWVGGWRNPGLGFDVGFDYQHDTRWSFSGSLIDLGFMSWTGNINSMQIDGNSRWEGLDLARLLDFSNVEEEDDELIPFSVADSFFFHALHPIEQSFVLMAPLKAILAAHYSLPSGIQFSAFNQMMFLNDLVRESFYLTAAYPLNKTWILTSGLSLTQGALIRIPFSLAFKSPHIDACLSIGNVLGVILPDYSTQFGGAFSLVYKFRLPSRYEEKGMKYYPFFRPYRREEGVD